MGSFLEKHDAYGWGKVAERVLHFCDHLEKCVGEPGRCALHLRHRQAIKKEIEYLRRQFRED
jgi:hypothetical protein